MCPDPSGFPSLDDDVLLKINSINMTAPLLCAKYAIIEMQKNEPSSGVIIGNSSVGAIMPLEVGNMLPQYTPTKAYMDCLTRNIATTHAASGIKAYNVNPAAIQTEMWEKIYDEIPAYAKETLTELGVDSKEAYAIMFNDQIKAPGADPMIMPDSVAQVALHFADGSTVADSGDCLVIAPGCTFHVKDLYPWIYCGFAKGVDMDTCRRDWTGAPHPSCKPAAAAAPAAASPATTTTTTTTTAGSSTTTVTSTVTASQIAEGVPPS
jgi:transcriptional regulator of met regulon